jgi:competence protein ComEC
VSPLVWLAAASWLGSCAGTEAALKAWQDSSPAPVLAAAVIAALVCGVASRLGGRTVRWMALWAAVALVVALARGVGLSMTAERLDAAAPGSWTATAAGDPLDSAFGTSVTVRLEGVTGSPAVQINWPKGEEPPRYGERMELDARLRVAVRGGPSSADAFRSGELLRASPWRVRLLGPAPGVVGFVTAWRNGAIDRLRAIGGRGAEALASMIYAARPQGDGLAALDDAKTAGVAWLITASGIHLGVIVLLAERLASVLGLGRRGRGAVAVAAAGCVAVAAGLRLSLLRATLTAAAAVVGRLVGRRRDATATLGAAVLLLVLCDPAAPYDAGLAIAISAVGAIALLGPLAKRWLTPLVGRHASWALGTSITAQLGVAPLAASMFGGVSLTGPFVLAVTAAPVQAAVVLGLFGSALCLLSDPMGAAVLRLSAEVAGLATRIWGAAARLPGAVAAVPAVPWWAAAAWFATGVALWLRWPIPRRAMRVRAGALALTAALLAATMSGGAGSGSLQVLDVGQGDSILIRDGGHAVLVDVGPDGAVLRNALARAGVRALDGIVLTHAHDDHVGGLDGLVGVVRPGWIAVPDVQDTAVEALARRASTFTGRVLRMRRGMVFTVGAINVRVLWPRGGDIRLSANDTSVVLLLERAGRRALLLGDAEEQAQRGVLEAWTGTVDVVKVAHHGSVNGNVPAALETWAPKVALISVGKGNRFGHPHAAALKELARIGAQVHRTDLEGDLSWELGVVPGGAWAGAIAPVTGAAPSATRAPTGSTVLGRSAAARAPIRLCDNPWRGRRASPPPTPRERDDTWPPPTSAISSPSTSSTAPRSCCWSAPRSACATVWPPSPTSTSTWRRSTGPRPPPTTSSTPRTPCRS